VFSNYFIEGKLTLRVVGTSHDGMLADSLGHAAALGDRASDYGKEIIKPLHGCC
jgi:hypothetical protein